MFTVALKGLPRSSPLTVSFRPITLRSSARTFATKTAPRPLAKSNATSSPFASLSKRFNSTNPASTISTVQPFSWTRLLGSAAVVGGGIFLANAVLNRETRGGFSEGERSYLNETFTYVGVGVGMTALLARWMHSSGVSLRVMSMNPWMVLGIGLVGGIGSMMGTIWTSPENTVQKYAFFTAFQAFQAVTLSPLLFLYSPALIARAGLYTVGLVGSLAYVGATAKSDQYLYLGGPLLAGLTVVVLSSLAPMVLPMTYMRTLAITQSVSLYGGLAVFGGFVLFDTQKILAHARLAEAGRIKRDPVGESISLELDFFNLFIRILTILGMNQSKRK